MDTLIPISHGHFTVRLNALNKVPDNERRLKEKRIYPINRWILFKLRGNTFGNSGSYHPSKEYKYFLNEKKHVYQHVKQSKLTRGTFFIGPLRVVNLLEFDYY